MGERRWRCVTSRGIGCPWTGPGSGPEARLDGSIRCETGYDDSQPPESIRDSWVPIWVRMELYKGQETPKDPDGTIYGPIAASTGPNLLTV
jgi:hypothetical protein